MSEMGVQQITGDLRAIGGSDKYNVYRCAPRILWRCGVGRGRPGDGSGCCVRPNNIRVCLQSSHSVPLRASLPSA